MTNKDKAILKAGGDPIQAGIADTMKVSLRGPGNGMKSHLSILDGELYFPLEIDNYTDIFGHDRARPGTYKWRNNEWVLG